MPYATVAAPIGATDEAMDEWLNKWASADWTLVHIEQGYTSFQHSTTYHHGPRYIFHKP